MIYWGFVSGSSHAWTTEVVHRVIHMGCACFWRLAGLVARHLGRSREFSCVG